MLSIVSLLLGFSASCTVAQNCTFAQSALLSSQRIYTAKLAYANELKPLVDDLYVTQPHPGFELFFEGSVNQPSWDDFRKAEILLNTAEFINHKMFFDKQCNDLSAYTSCFSPSDTCYNMNGLVCDRNAKYSTIGGTCNNLQYPKLGAQFSAYGRLIEADYHDCLHSERRTAIDSIELPPPRGIGNILAENGYGEQKPTPVVSAFNLLGAWFGQLITHDTGSRIHVQRNNFGGPGILCCSQDYTKRLSEGISHPACDPMDIPTNDPFYNKFGAACLNYVRSQTTFSNNCKVGAAQQSNSVSAYMDLTIVYGDDLNILKQLRTGKLGQLKTNAGNVLPEVANCREQPCYFLGDARVVQTPMLALCHSLMLRLHNTIAPQINPTNDELAFQEARRLTIALYQRITFNEWLPFVLGQGEQCNRQIICDPSIGPAVCGKYNANVDPSTTNDHTHGAFRWLHALIPSVIKFYGPDRSVLASQFLSDLNSTNLNILERNYDTLLRGLLFDSVNYGGYSPELRNRLFKNARGMGVDLFSVDVKRGRDHGVPPFHSYIKFCINAAAQINTWADLQPYFTPASLLIMQKIYKSPLDIDLLVGVLGEKREGPYTLLGPVGRCIIAQQFDRFKFGDRFFYQWTDLPTSFTQAQLREIESFTMAKFLCMVTNVGQVPQNAFLTPSSTNPMVSCSSLAKLNFALFKK